MLRPTSGGGTPGGSNTQVQYNNAGAFGGAAALVYAASTAHLTVTSQANGDIGVKLVSAGTGQTAPLLSLHGSQSGSDGRAEIALDSRLTGGRKRTIAVSGDDLKMYFGSNGTDYSYMQINNGPGTIFGGHASSSGWGFQGKDAGSILFGSSSTNAAQQIAFGVRPESTYPTINIGTLIDFFGAAMTAQRESSATNSVQNYWRWRHNTSGTPAAGFGGSLSFQLNSSTTANQDAGLVEVLWATATHASRAARVVHSVYDTAVREGFRIEASGTEPMIGFLGANAAARQLLATGAGATVDNVITVLQTFGLCKQS